MDEEQQQQQSEESREESALLKLHALPRLRQPVAPARCACLRTMWPGITTGLPLKPGHEARLPLSFYRLY